MIRTAGVVVMLVLVSGPAGAQDADSPEIRWVMSSLAHEHVICSSYYAIGAACLREPRDAATSKRVAKVGFEMLRRATDYTKAARLKPETVGARFEMAARDMKAKIENDCGNISILMSQHAVACKALGENIERRANQLIDEALRRAGYPVGDAAPR